MIVQLVGHLRIQGAHWQRAAKELLLMLLELCTPVLRALAALLRVTITFTTQDQGKGKAKVRSSAEPDNVAICHLVSPTGVLHVLPSARASTKAFCAAHDKLRHAYVIPTLRSARICFAANEFEIHVP